MQRGHSGWKKKSQDVYDIIYDLNLLLVFNIGRWPFFYLLCKQLIDSSANYFLDLSCDH